MRRFDGLVLQEQRHLKWRVLDPIENMLMVLCGICHHGIQRAGSLRHRHPRDRPSVAMAARNDDGLFHLRNVYRRRRRDATQRPSLSRGACRIDERQQAVFFSRCSIASSCCASAFCMVYFGYLNVLDGFKSLRMPSMTPIAYLYIAIPICGALVALFTIEQMVNGWRKGFPPKSRRWMKRRTSL